MLDALTITEAEAASNTAPRAQLAREIGFIVVKRLFAAAPAA